MPHTSFRRRGAFIFGVRAPRARKQNHLGIWQRVYCTRSNQTFTLFCHSVFVFSFINARKLHIISWQEANAGVSRRKTPHTRQDIISLQLCPEIEIFESVWVSCDQMSTNCASCILINLLYIFISTNRSVTAYLNGLV